MAKILGRGVAAFFLIVWALGMSAEAAPIL